MTIDTNQGAIPPQNTETTRRYKICLVGDGGTGKTTYINRVLNGNFIRQYHATQGAVTKYVPFHLNNGDSLEYEVWDTAGQEKNVGLKEGYYIGAIAGFFFFDVNSRETMINIEKHVRSFVSSCGYERPFIFILANKIDIMKKKIDINRVVAKIKTYNPELIQISARIGYNFVKPFSSLTKKLYNNPNIELEAKLDLTPLENDYDFFADRTQEHSINNVDLNLTYEK